MKILTDKRILLWKIAWEKSMKRIIICLFILAMVFMITGCKSKENYIIAYNEEIKHSAMSLLELIQSKNIQ